MTNEEHIEQLKKLRSFHNGSYGRSINKAIEALEREPCNDAISRQTVKEQMIKYGFHAPDMTVIEFVEDLPSVRQYEQKYCDRNICVSNEYNGIGCDECEATKSQEPKTGYWIDAAEKDPWYRCSECRERVWGGHHKYCPNCGAFMRGEDK